MDVTLVRDPSQQRELYDSFMTSGFPLSILDLSFGVTINLGDYNFRKIDVGGSYPFGIRAWTPTYKIWERVYSTAIKCANI